MGSERYAVLEKSLGMARPDYDPVLNGMSKSWRLSLLFKDGVKDGPSSIVGIHPGFYESF